MPLFDRVPCEVSFDIRMGAHRPAGELEPRILNIRSETKALKINDFAHSK